MITTISIKNKTELNEYISADKKSCFGKEKITLEDKVRKPFKNTLFNFLKYNRKYAYFCMKRDNCKNIIQSKIYSFIVKIYDIRKNRLGMRINVEMLPLKTGKSVRICHPNVILNGYVGENCIFHGNNVVGNKKTGDSAAIPRIGNNVDVGVGAIIIGDIEIADNCVIGAGAVVIKSIEIPGTVVAGVPATAIGGESNA